MNCDIGLWPIIASFQTILSNTGWSVVAKIASISMQIFPSLFKMTANRRGGFPDLYFLVHILLTVRKFHVHGYAAHATGRSFCFTCKLLSCPDNNAFAGIGYCDWKKCCLSDGKT